MPKADGMILSKEEESDAEVRREDQDRINEFGRLNARLHEVRDEVNKLKVSERIFECLCFPTRIQHLIIGMVLKICIGRCADREESLGQNRRCFYRINDGERRPCDA
jgi:hypothetical protein